MKEAGAGALGGAFESFSKTAPLQRAAFFWDRDGLGRGQTGQSVRPRFQPKRTHPDKHSLPHSLTHSLTHSLVACLLLLVA
jgi:hypothetical protein